MSRSLLPWPLLLLVASLAAPVVARADRGALSVEAGGGLSGLAVRAPFASEPVVTPGLVAAVQVGARYALSNGFEVGVAGFFEPPATYFHNGTVTVVESGAFPGTLSHALARWGGRVGGRWVMGMVWRLVVGADLGWSHRSYSRLRAVGDSDPGAALDWRLDLEDFGRDDLSLGLALGVEWAAGDHWSVSLLPRAEALLGSDPTFAATVALSFAWSWYL